eukprot:TRINITY_DN4247_c0_g1_i1.p1 TRINITY_DN4247_c0_g1~~TRINITY_DN4247_c0_g1_i1.p1  ORF type:complete len:360 (-),score=115.60 TRINITY_DN4247_c0_g1_i1:1227-2279(-)
MRCLLVLVACLACCSLAHNLFVLPAGYEKAGDEVVVEDFMRYLLHGGRYAAASQSHASLLTKPAVNTLVTMHVASLETFAAEFPLLSKQLEGRAMHTVASADHSCPVLSYLAQDVHALKVFAPAPSCPATTYEVTGERVSFEWVPEVGFVAGEQTVDIVALRAQLGETQLDLADETIARAAYECALLSALPSLLPQQGAQLTSVLADAAALRHFEAGSEQYTAIAQLLDATLAKLVPELEKSGTTELLVMDCLGQQVGVQAGGRRALQVSSSSSSQSVLVNGSSSSLLSSSSSSNSNKTVNFNQVGSNQIVIWLTVMLFLLVVLSAYFMTACGIDATKDTLLYFKTTTYH